MRVPKYEGYPLEEYGLLRYNQIIYVASNKEIQNFETKGTSWKHVLKGKRFTSNNTKPRLLVSLVQLGGDIFEG